MVYKPSIMKLRGYTRERNDTMVIKKALLWLGRRLALAILFLLIFFLVQAVWPLNLAAAPVSPEETILMLFVTCAVNALVIAELAHRGIGPRYIRILGLAAFIFGVVTLQAIDESLFFKSFVGIPVPQQWQLMGHGLIRAILMALAAIWLIPARQAHSRYKLNWRQRSTANRVMRVIVLALLFPFIYKFFGYFIAWQSPAVLEYYQFGAQIDQTRLMLFQVLRGLIWCGMAWLGLYLTRGGKLEQILLIGLAMGILHSIQIIVPSSFMPEAVRYVHFVELLASISLFGIIAAWGLRGESRRGLYIRRNRY